MEVSLVTTIFFIWLLNDTISATVLFSVYGFGDKDIIFGEMRPRICYRLPDIRLTVLENPGKTTPGNQFNRESNPRRSATPDQQASALVD